MEKTYAVVDIGTLKVKTVIATILPTGDLNIIYSSNNLTCFGCDLDQNNGYVKEEYLGRTIAELQRIKEVFTQYNVKNYRVVSTHAMRRAKNKDAIITRIKDEVGFDVENISQEQEAEFFFNAVMRTFTSDKDYAIVDVGGGSVQILIGNQRELKQAHMMQTGAIFLHDNFTQNPNVATSYTTTHDIEKMKDVIIEQLLPFKAPKNVPIIYGSSMIIDIMKNINLPLENHADSTIHPYQTYTEHLKNYLESVLPLNYEQREAKYNTGQKGYVWGVDKAFLNIITIAEHLESPYIVPTNANIAQGIIYSMIGK